MAEKTSDPEPVYRRLEKICEIRVDKNMTEAIGIQTVKETNVSFSIEGKSKIESFTGKIFEALEKLVKKEELQFQFHDGYMEIKSMTMDQSNVVIITIKKEYFCESDFKKLAGKLFLRPDDLNMVLKRCKKANKITFDFKPSFCLLTATAGEYQKRFTIPALDADGVPDQFQINDLLLTSSFKIAPHDLTEAIEDTVEHVMTIKINPKASISSIDKNTGLASKTDLKITEFIGIKDYSNRYTVNDFLSFKEVEKISRIITVRTGDAQPLVIEYILDDNLMIHLCKGPFLQDD